MRLIWSPPAQRDLVRIHRFLAPKSPRAATGAVRALRAGALPLLDHPRIGERVDNVEANEVRRILVRDYELRYEVRADQIVVLRIWHTREER
jgi:plasmid stabilization system protein ParE